MRLVKHSSSGAVVLLNDGTELSFDFTAEEDRLAPLFAGTAWGTILWDSSLVLTAYLETLDPAEVQGQAVVELGACCGLPGLACSARGAAKTVLTDQADYLGAAQKALALNAHAVRASHVAVAELEWGRDQALDFVARHGQADLVLCSDCVSTDVYGRESWQALVGVLDVLCRGRVLVCSTRRPGDGLESFLCLLGAKFASHRVVPAADVAALASECGIGAAKRGSAAGVVEIHEFRLA